MTVSFGGFGLTPAGWLFPSLAVIDDKVDAGLQQILGASAGTDPDGKIPLQSMAGQLKSLVDDVASSLWDLGQTIAASVDPQQTTGIAQDGICALTGTKREGAQFSTTVATCTGTPNTPLPVGRTLSVLATGARFDSQNALKVSDANYPSSTILALTAWAQSTNYVAGARVTANGNAYQCTIGGMSSAIGVGPASTTLGLDIIDNTVTWRFLGIGTGAVDVGFQAEAAGSIGALANQLTQIATPLAGWSSATNLLDAVPGRVQESDAALRRRRDAELALAGNTTALAILARVTAVNQGSTDPAHQPPLSVKVLANPTDVVDVNGLPPHSVEVIALGGTAADIALEIWLAKGAGTNLYSGLGQSTVITDPQGNPQTVAWTRPQSIPIYIIATVYYDATKWPAVGAAALVQQAALSALLTFGTGYPVSQSVRALPLGAAIIDEPSQVDANGNAVVPAAAGSPPLAGGLDVSPIFIGTAPAPGTSTPIAIGVRQIATFSSGNCTLTAVAETP